VRALGDALAQSEAAVNAVTTSNQLNSLPVNGRNWQSLMALTPGAVDGANAQAGFPFVKWQTEAMWRRYEAGAFADDTDGDGTIDLALPRETLKDRGAYSQILWGFRRNWIIAACFGVEQRRPHRRRHHLTTISAARSTSNKERTCCKNR